MENKIEWFNEKGNVRAKVRTMYRDAIIEKVRNVFSKDVEQSLNVNGGVSFVSGKDATTDEKIWAHIELKINTKSPNIDSYSGIEIKRNLDLPQLF